MTKWQNASINKFYHLYTIEFILSFHATPFLQTQISKISINGFYYDRISPYPLVDLQQFLGEVGLRISVGESNDADDEYSAEQLNQNAPRHRVADHRLPESQI